MTQLHCSRPVLVALLFSLLLFPQALFAGIYDCFLFYQELDILEIRLEELYPYVDKFVLVESVETFTGKTKPLYFAENCKRYEKFLDKIIHVIVTDRFETDDPWQREFFQRNQIMRGLQGCGPRDYILISDADEIPKGSRIQELIRPLALKQTHRVGAHQKLFFIYLNRFNPAMADWNGTVATLFAYLLQSSPQALRDSRGLPPIIPDMGWHFTWMGGSRLVSAKASAQSHTGYTSYPQFIDERLFHELYEHLNILPMTLNNFPKFVIDNQEYLKQKGLLE